MLSFSQIVKFVTQDLLSQKRLGAFFVFNLVLGFLGFLLLQVFQASLDQQTKGKAQQILGGDVAISARRLISDQEVKQMEQKVNVKFEQKTKVYDFFAMVKYNEQSRLVMVRTVQESYPLYGDLTVKFVDGQASKLTKVEAGKVYLDPELFEQLKISTQEKTHKLKVGDSFLDISAEVTSDPSRTFRLGALAPFILISEDDLAATNLIKPGSTITTSVLYKLQNPMDADLLKSQFEKEYLDPSLRFTSALQEEEGGNSVFRYLIDYLGLVSLIAIGLSFLCLSYMLNWLFQIQKKDIAIYKVLGMSENSILTIQICKNLFLSVFSYIIAVSTIYILTPVMQKMVTDYFQLPLVLEVDLWQMLISFLIVIIGPQLMAIPSYVSVVATKPLVLLRTELGEQKLMSNKVQISWLIMMVLSFWAVAVWQSHSFKTGSLFVAGLFAAIAITFGFIYVFRYVVSRSVNVFDLETKYALLGLVRKPGATNLILITMTLAIVVLTLLPHIKKSIIAEVRPENSSQIPSVFMFDIQMDQKDELQKIVKEQLGKELSLTPMVRSRILKINDQDYERVTEEGMFKTREDENEARFRNRGVNLTYKSQMQESEELIDGQWFNADSASIDTSAIPEISLEQRYAERIGAKINDVMTFDVQGLEVKGKVTSIRRVRWTSFQPNFFIVFEPGVLEEAPQNYLTAIMQVDQQHIQKLQNTVVDKFANISIINVKNSVESSLVFIDQMAIALQFMAILSLVVGFFIFAILLSTQITERVNEMNLLKVLGSSEQQVDNIFLKQFGFVIFICLILGLILGTLIAYVLMSVLFKLQLYIDYKSMLLSAVFLILLTFVILKISTYRLRFLHPLQLLKNY